MTTVRPMFTIHDDGTHEQSLVRLLDGELPGTVHEAILTERADAEFVHFLERAANRRHARAIRKARKAWNGSDTITWPKRPAQS